jgi:hypothetical protein
MAVSFHSSGAPGAVSDLTYLESLMCTGDISQELFLKDPFYQLITVMFLGCNIVLDDCIEILY